jgi:hypothetical protein
VQAGTPERSGEDNGANNESIFAEISLLSSSGEELIALEMSNWNTGSSVTEIVEPVEGSRIFQVAPGRRVGESTTGIGFEGIAYYELSTIAISFVIKSDDISKTRVEVTSDTLVEEFSVDVNDGVAMENGWVEITLFLADEGLGNSTLQEFAIYSDSEDGETFYLKNIRLFHER